MDALFNPHSNAAPARHNIESDSDSDFSDPEAGDVVSRPPRKEIKKQQDTVEVKGRSGGKCIVALGQAGQIWTGGFKSEPSEDSLVSVNEDTIGSSTALGQDITLLCLSTAHLPLSSLNKLASQILDELKPTSLQVIDAYEPDLYLPEPSSDPPLRLLQSSSLPSTSVQPYEVPNLITGLTAALAAQSARADIPVQLYLVPCVKAGRPSGLYDPSSAVNASEVDPVALAALKAAPSIATWQDLGWSVKHISTPKRWKWLQRAEKDRAKRARDQEDQMYM